MFRVCLLLPFLILGAYAEAALEVQNQKSDLLGALLQAQISIKPLNAFKDQQRKIQPGATVKITAVIKNVGDQPNAPGEFFVRFAFPKPWKKEKNNVLYQTEIVSLPTIKPGNFITFNFSALHQWPSLFDFIRHDWAIREYEGIVLIGKEEQLIGSTSIAFSAYYYEEPKEKAAKVLSASQPYYTSFPKQNNL
jgi:hypothetical protein